MELFFLALLILTMAAALGSGYPVAFALPGAAILTIGLAAITGLVFESSTDAYFLSGGPSQWLTAGVTNLRGVYWEVERDTLIAIPLFIFMGIMLQRSKIAEDLLVTMAQLFGAVPGGLGISVVFVGALLAATTGIVGATVVAMGLISLPAMMRHNYSNALATGTIAASGTLGQIIPPSIVLIILADQLASAVDQASTARKNLHKETTGELSMPSEFDVVSTSAGDMFMGAFLPGLVLVAVYMLFILIVAIARPKLAPPVPFEGRFDARFLGRVLFILVPPLALIFVVLGSIIAGIATVNQAGAIGAVGAAIMAGYRLSEGRRGTYLPALLALVSVVVLVVLAIVDPINVKRIETSQDVTALIIASIATVGLLVAVFWSLVRTFGIEDTLRGVMLETAKTTSLVFIILLGAAMLTAAFRAFGGEELVREFLTSLPGGFWTQFVIVMAVIFVLGFFLDFIEIAVVVVPIVTPILLADPSANVTAVWLGVMIGLNIQTSFLTPPFGFALFYLRGVAPAAVKTVQIYRGVIAFICLQLLALGIVGYFPSLVNYLPTRMSLSGETAPPPINPRLQACVEKYVFEQYALRRDEISGAISRAQALDISGLPDDLRKDTAEAFEKAQATFGLLQEIQDAEQNVAALVDDYRPLHQQVRSVERRIRGIDAEIKKLETELSRVPATSPGEAEELRVHIAELGDERKALASEIPAEWEAVHKEFADILAVETKARAAYRRNVDSAYEPIQELLAVLRDVEALAGLSDVMQGLGAEIAALDPEVGVERLAEVSSMIGDVEGTKDIRSAISKARRAIKGKNPEPDEAAKQIELALAAYNEDLAWRQDAAANLVEPLEAYDAAIADTIGLRKQSRLPEEQVPSVAVCMSHHRDISLHF